MREPNQFRVHAVESGDKPIDAGKAVVIASAVTDKILSAMAEISPEITVSDLKIGRCGFVTLEFYVSKDLL